MKRRVVYAEANYAALVRKPGYFVDKTDVLLACVMIEEERLIFEKDALS